MREPASHTCSVALIRFGAGRTTIQSLQERCENGGGAHGCCCLKCSRSVLVFIFVRSSWPLLLPRGATQACSVLQLLLTINSIMRRTCRRTCADIHVRKKKQNAASRGGGAGQVWSSRTHAVNVSNALMRVARTDLLGRLGGAAAERSPVAATMLGAVWNGSGVPKHRKAHTS